MMNYFIHRKRIIMTDQITVKLNEEKFRPLIEGIDKFTGPGMVKSDSDLVAKCVFFTHCFMYEPKDECGGKTLWDCYADRHGVEKADMVLGFLKAYSEFCKKK